MDIKSSLTYHCFLSFIYYDFSPEIIRPLHACPVHAALSAAHERGSNFEL